MPGEARLIDKRGERTQTNQASGGSALAVALLGTFIGSTNNSIASVALPAVLDDFPSTSVTQGTWLITGYILATAVSMPIAGRLIDFFGTRRVFVNAFLLFAAGSAVCAVAGSYPQLMAGRIMQGLAGGPVLPTVFLTVGSCFPRERQGRPLGVWAAVNGASLAAAPVMGGVLVATLGWRSIFWVDVPFALLVFALTRRWLPDIGGSATGRFDLAGAALFASSLLGLMVVLSQAKVWGLASPALLAAGIATGTALVAYFVSALRSDSPFFDLRLFRHATYATLTLVASLQMAALFGLFFAIPLLVVNFLALPATTAGVLLSLTPLVSTLVAPLVGAFADRAGTWPPLVIGGCLLSTGGLVLAAFAQGPLLALSAGLVVLGLGIGFIMSPSAAGVTRVFGSRSGVAIGAFNTARFASGVAGATVFTLVFEQVAGIPVGGSIAQGAGRDLLLAFRVVFFGIALTGVGVVAGALTLTRDASPPRPADARLSDHGVGL